MIGGLPGAVEDPGVGAVVEVLLDGLLADAVSPDPDGAAATTDASALAAHREHRVAWYGDLVGALRVPASSVAGVRAALLPRDHARPVTLVVDTAAADPGADLAAYTLLLDDDRVEVRGVELPLPGAPSPAEAARRALATLHVSVPAWFVVPPLPGWEAARDVIAEDVAPLLPPETDLAGAARLLRHAVDRELPFAVTAGELPLVTGPGAAGVGLLNLLGAVRAALNGAAPDELAAVLASTAEDPLAAAARRMSDADAAVVRAFLPAVTCPSIRRTVSDLEAAGPDRLRRRLIRVTAPGAGRENHPQGRRPTPEE